MNAISAAFAAPSPQTSASTTPTRPTPLPDDLLPQGPDKWSKAGTIGSMTLHAKPGMDFKLASATEPSKRVTTSALKLDLFPTEFRSLGGNWTFEDALTAAAKLSQSTDETTAIMQAANGAFHLARVIGASRSHPVTGRPEQPGGGYLHVPVDFSPSLDRKLPAQVGQLDVEITEPDVKALVGALTWIDTRTQLTHSIARS